VWKIFLFQIVNSFLPLLSAAQRDMNALQSEMINVFVAKQGMEFFVSYMLPIIKHRWRMYSSHVDSSFMLTSKVLVSVVRDTVKTVVDVEDVLTDAKDIIMGNEREEEGDNDKFKEEFMDTSGAQPTVLGHYIMEDPEDVINKYADQTIQFAYMTCFANSFPLAPLIAFVNNVFVLRFDIRNTIFVNRRATFARETNGFGAWREIFSLVSLIGIFVNCFIIYHTSKTRFDLYGIYTLLDESPVCENSILVSLNNSAVLADQAAATRLGNSTISFIRDYPKCAGEVDLCESLVCIKEHYHAKLISVAMVLLFCLSVKWVLQILIEDVPSWITKEISAMTLDAMFEQEAGTAQNTGQSSVVQEKQALERQEKALKLKDLVRMSNVNQLKFDGPPKSSPRADPGSV
jgi:hypothetical protein